MNQSVRHLTLILIVSGTVFFTNLGTPRLWDRDEPRNAGCASEMLAANDWVTPTFNAELREHKPVLTYWLMMLSYSIFGVGEFGARFPSAMLGVGTTVLIYLVGRRLFRPSTGFWAAIAISTTMMFSVASRAATPDAPLIFFSTLAMAIYVFGTTLPFRDGQSSSGFVRLFPSWPVAITMYGAMGLAVLAKGPIGLVLPTAVLGMFLLIQRLPVRERSSSLEQEAGSPSFVSRWLRFAIDCARPFAPIHFLKTCWAMRPVTAIVCAMVVALPWYVWVHFRTDGEWTYGFFIKHNVGRAMNAMDGHNGGLFFYPVALIVGFFPWSVFWLTGVIDAVRQVRSQVKWRAEYTFAMCWVGVYLGLFSIAKTKLPSYITPCYPGFALLMGVYFDRFARSETTLGRIWPRLGYGSLILIGIGVLVAFPLVSKMFLPGVQWLCVIGLIPIIGGGVALWLTERSRKQQAASVTAFTAVAFATALFAFATIRIDQHRHLDQLVHSIYTTDGEVDDAVDIASFARSEPSWVFYAQQPIHALNDAAAAATFLETAPTGEAKRVVITTQNRGRELIQHLSHVPHEVKEVPYFLQGDTILILKSKSPITRTSYETSTEHAVQ